MAAGETDLDTLIASMEPTLLTETYVYASVSDSVLPTYILEAFAMMREAEGVCLVLPMDRVRADKLEHDDFLGRIISLTVHSSLAAVGLTGAFATALGHAEISCNVIAGRFHDHLLVQHDRADDAMRVLRDMATEAQRTVQKGRGLPSDAS